ncbi:MAG: ATP-binding protein [Acidimicrobiia bacterium]|nr:ATP-binding protein [Acidimicrobiia bacterium]
MTTGPEPTTGSLVRFRAAALRRSVLLGWVVLVVLTAAAVRSESFPDRRFLITVGAFLVVLSAAAGTDWTALLHKRYGQLVAWAWTIALLVTLTVIATVDGLFGAALPIFPGIVVLTGLILEPVRHIFVSVLAALMVILASVVTAEADTLSDLVIPLLTIGVVAAATALIGTEFAKEARLAAQHQQALEDQRADFQRLYAVSTTLAGAESLSEGLPEIVGRICRYVDAQVGVVFLHRPEDHTLRVMSPMWVNGHVLDVDDITVRVTAGGIVSKVFRSGRAIRLERITDRPDQFGVLGELGIDEAIVAPLRVEGHNVGVLAIGDPARGAFTDEQVDDVSSLAAPAALVLSQLGRYEAAAEMSRRMREVAQMKTDFVSVVSHELRTPLTSIIGSLDTVKRPGIRPEAADELLDSARRQANRLQRLIEDLLFASRVDRQTIPISIQPVPVLELLTEIQDTVQTDSRITVSVEPPDLLVAADPDHLRRVFINLVDNADKYAPGSPVEVIAREVRSHIDIDVVDHGEGIPTGMQDRIFDAFTQLERSETRTKGGTGLGLSIVRGLVEAMGGTVAVADTPGGGATFTVSLPMARVQAEVSPV